MADDDSYINIEHITKYLMKNHIVSEDQGLKDHDRYVPLPTERAIFAGCRVRTPESALEFTLPFGGFGTLFSKGSLQQWM